MILAGRLGRSAAACVATRRPRVVQLCYEQTCQVREGLHTWHRRAAPLDRNKRARTKTSNYKTQLPQVLTT